MGQPVMTPPAAASPRVMRRTPTLIRRMIRRSPWRLALTLWPAPIAPPTRPGRLPPPPCLTGIYGTFTLTAAGAWSYALDNDCGTTPGVQGTTGDAGEANDPGCATNALAMNATTDDTLRVRANDGVGSTTGTPGQGRSRYSAIQEVTVTVTGANDAPELVEGSRRMSTWSTCLCRATVANSLYTDCGRWTTLRPSCHRPGWGQGELRGCRRVRHPLAFDDDPTSPTNGVFTGTTATAVGRHRTFQVVGTDGTDTPR